MRWGDVVYYALTAVVFGGGLYGVGQLGGRLLKWVGA